MKKSQRPHTRRSKTGKLFNAGRKKYKYEMPISKHIDNIRICSSMPKMQLKMLEAAMIQYKIKNKNDKLYKDSNLLLDSVGVLDDMLKIKLISDSEYEGAVRYINTYIHREAAMS